MKDMGRLMKHAQQLQGAMSRIQADLAGRRIEASSGGGVVRAVVSGTQELLEVHIDPEVVNPQDVGMLEDLILAAVREALARAREIASEEMKKAAGGLSLPGLL